MFHIEPSPVVGPFGDKKRVIDESRDVWLQRVSARDRDPGDAMKLVWRGTAIPFDAFGESPSTEVASRAIFVRIDSFGNSAYAQARGGIAPVEFASNHEYDEAIALAAEALLVFGSFYDGLEKPDGLYRIRYELRGAGEREVRLSTFGYPSEQ